MANAIEREITTLQLKEKKLVTEIKRNAKTGNEAATKISICQLIKLRQQITKLQACLQQMSPAKQTEEETEELTNQVLDEIGVDVASLGSGPSQSLATPSFIDEITQRVTQDVESRFTTTIKNLTARVLFLESQGVAGSMSLREVSDASSGQQASKENE